MLWAWLPWLVVAAWATVIACVGTFPLALGLAIAVWTRWLPIARMFTLTSLLTMAGLALFLGAVLALPIRTWTLIPLALWSPVRALAHLAAYWVLCSWLFAAEWALSA